MVSAETLMMLAKPEPRKERGLGPDWLNRYPIIQLKREDLTGDPRDDVAMLLRKIEEQSP